MVYRPRILDPPFSPHQEKNHDLNQKCQLVLTDTFSLIDTSLAATDEEIFRLYMDLVEDEDLREKFITIFTEELALVHRHLAIILNRPIEERRKNHHYSNLLRSSLMRPLHQKQVQLLRDWRGQKASGDVVDEDLQTELLMTINALSGAMRNTG